MRGFAGNFIAGGASGGIRHSIKTRICFAFISILLLICTSCGKKPSCADEVLMPVASGDNLQYFDKSLLIDEDNYSGIMHNAVLPYLASRMQQDTLITEHGNEIHYETFTSDSGRDTIVIFEGFREYTRKYDEAVYYFLKNGYNICLFDHAGLGLSSRDKRIANDENAVSLVYIDSFSTYLSDAAEVVEKVARLVTKENAQDGRLLLFAHSMGGCIGALFLEQYPNVFDKAVLTAPMLATNTGVPEWMAYSLSAVMEKTGNGTKMAVGQKTYSASLENITAPVFAESGARVAYKAFLRESDTHYQTNAATYSWTAEAVRATHKAVKRSNVRKITVPILMFQSQHDTRVRPSGQNRFRRRSGTRNGSQVTLVYCPDVRHEIYDSRNEYLAPYYDRILRFYADK